MEVRLGFFDDDGGVEGGSREEGVLLGFGVISGRLKRRFRRVHVVGCFLLVLLRVVSRRVVAPERCVFSGLVVRDRGERHRDVQKIHVAEPGNL
jgi:hypothetical protein